ncbi:acetylesterase [Desulfonema ishimotonii]|uniref:Acetylesterase n=1 Tax=Desulfonema ishimotonii TaxID=45657 RepID=A0A401FVI0_9BACT|nr:alpha/beta fold hydrolase [Desulfonema ishimotonii]GBC60982.1 acetylesterase [Desulfonema ishimotonii]
MPLTFDMPLDALKTYQGCNPKPDDFDMFWDRSIADMKALGTVAKLERAEFQTAFAECFHLGFTGLDGARIHAKFLRPRNATGPCPAVLMFHGYGGNAGDWVDKLSYVAAGYGVAALDCRGQGGLSRDTGGVTGPTHTGHIIRGLDDAPDGLLFRRIFLDAAQLARILMAMPEVDENRVSAIGRSQGGGLALACAALEPRIRRVAPTYPFLCDYRRVWEIDLVMDAYHEIREYFRYFDPRHEREEEIFSRLGYIDVQHLCSRIRGEVFMGTGLMDMVCPPSTQFAAYNRISAPKSLALYPDFGHEDLPGHPDRIFQFITADRRREKD